MAAKYLLTVEYAGSAFRGAARDTSVKRHPYPVQNYLDEALSHLSVVEAPRSVISSRTDTGVNALANTFHVSLTKKDNKLGQPASEAYDARTVKMCANHFLKDKPVRVVKAQIVHPDFHARFNAVGREYQYHMCFCGERDSKDSPIFLKDRAWFIRSHLNVAAMKLAAGIFWGSHDFSAFRNISKESKEKSPFKSIDHIALEEHPFAVAHPNTVYTSFALLVFFDSSFNLMISRSMEGLRLLTLTVRSRSFLFRQVRNITAAIVQVGLGRMEPEYIHELFALRDRNLLPAPAPPEGLFLTKVIYPPDYLLLDKFPKSQWSVNVAEEEDDGDDDNDTDVKV